MSSHYSKPYRAAYFQTPHTGQETVLTGPEHATLSDEDLIIEALAEAKRADLIGTEWPQITEAELRAGLHIGKWTG